MDGLTLTMTTQETKTMDEYMVNDYFEQELQIPADSDAPTEDEVVTQLRTRIATLEALLSRSYDEIARPDIDLDVHFELLADLDKVLR